MKIVFFVIFFSTFLDFLRCQDQGENNHKLLIKTHSNNLVNSVKTVFAENDEVGSTITVLTSIHSNYLSQDFTQELLQLLFTSYDYGFRHEFFGLLSSRTDRHTRIFLIEEFDDLNISAISPNQFKFSGLFVIVLLKGKIREIPEIFKLLWGKQKFNVIAIYENENSSISVETFKPFQYGKCNDTTPVLINVFKGGKFVNGNKNLFQDKVKDLHNCPIRFSVAINLPFVATEVFPNGTQIYKGRDINLITTIAESLNFKINYSYVGDTTDYLYENGSARGSMKALLDGDADMVISNYFLKMLRLKFFDASTSYLSDSMIFLITPGQEISSYQKLIFPFSLNLWISILSSFLIGFLIIYITKQQSKQVQEFVFGSRVTTPCLNLYAAFLGGTQTILPKRNFSRFLLMMFLLFSLVIRASYQGSFYKLLQSSLLHKEVQSFQEIVKNDFTFYIYFSNVDLIEATEVQRNR